MTDKVITGDLEQEDNNADRPLSPSAIEDVESEKSKSSKKRGKKSKEGKTKDKRVGGEKVYNLFRKKNKSKNVEELKQEVKMVYK